jgi:hypothetical protein
MLLMHGTSMKKITTIFWDVALVVCFKVTLALCFVLDMHDKINYIQFFTQEVSFLSGKVRTP